MASRQQIFHLHYDCAWGTKNIRLFLPGRDCNRFAQLANARSVPGDSPRSHGHGHSKKKTKTIEVTRRCLHSGPMPREESPTRTTSERKTQILTQKSPRGTSFGPAKQVCQRDTKQHTHTHTQRHYNEIRVVLPLPFTCGDGRVQTLPNGEREGRACTGSARLG